MFPFRTLFLLVVALYPISAMAEFQCKKARTKDDFQAAFGAEVERVQELHKARDITHQTRLNALT